MLICRALALGMRETLGTEDTEGTCYTNDRIDTADCQSGSSIYRTCSGPRSSRFESYRKSH